MSLIERNDCTLTVCPNAQQLEKYGFKCNCSDCGGPRLNGNCGIESKKYKLNGVTLTTHLEKNFTILEECCISFLGLISIIGEDKSKID
jgi:hypothetical protein